MSIEIIDLKKRYQDEKYEILKCIKNVLKKNKFLRCQAITSISNNSSIQTLIKCGFKKEGVMKKFLRNNQQKKSFDAVILAKTI